MALRFSPARGILIPFLAQCAATLVGCDDPPRDTVECDNPCEPDIEIEFETPLGPGRHDFVFTIDGEETACSADLEEDDRGELTSESDCTLLDLYISSTSISFWASPATVHIQHQSPQGCTSELTVAPTYEEWYSAQCDITCREATETFELPSCDDGMGGSGGEGGS